MDVNSMKDSLLAQYTNVYQNTASSKLTNSLSKTKEEATDEEMMDACKQFEQYFVEQIIKQVKKTIPKDNLLGDNDYMNMFEDNLVQSVAEKITDSGELGFAQQLYESMAVQHGSKPSTLKSEQVETMDTEKETVVETEKTE